MRLAVQVMHSVVIRMHMALYARAWCKWAAITLASRSLEAAQRRAVLTFNRVLSFAKQAALGAGWRSWRAMVRAEQEAESAKLTAAQRLSRVLWRMERTASGQVSLNRFQLRGAFIWWCVSAVTVHGPFYPCYP